MEAAHGSYANFTKSLDAALDGDSAFWNGTRIPDVEWVGDLPPVDSAKDDDFEWGVGEEADVSVALLRSWSTIGSTAGEHGTLTDDSSSSSLSHHEHYARPQLELPQLQSVTTSDFILFHVAGPQHLQDRNPQPSQFHS